MSFRIKVGMVAGAAMVATGIIGQSIHLVMVQTDDRFSDSLHLRATLPPPTVSSLISLPIQNQTTEQTTVYYVDLNEFRQACIDGNLTAVQEMHAHDPDLLSRPLQEDGSCSIHFASSFGHKELLDYIITHDPNTMLSTNIHKSHFIDIMNSNLTNYQKSYEHKKRIWGKIQDSIKTQAVDCEWVSTYLEKYVKLQISEWLDKHANCRH